MTLLNPELGQGPRVNAGLWENHGMVKVSEGQGTEPHGQTEDGYEHVNSYSTPPAPLPLLPTPPSPSPVSRFLLPASPWRSLLSILPGAAGCTHAGKVLVPGRRVVRWRWEAVPGSGGAGRGWGVTWHPRAGGLSAPAARRGSGQPGGALAGSRSHSGSAFRHE